MMYPWSLLGACGGIVRIRSSQGRNVRSSRLARGRVLLAHPTQLTALASHLGRLALQRGAPAVMEGLREWRAQQLGLVARVADNRKLHHANGRAPGESVVTVRC